MNDSKQFRENAISALRQLEESGESFVFLPERMEPAEQIIDNEENTLIQEADNQPHEETLEQFRLRIKDCRLCELHRGRTNFVFGAGDPDADMMFVGEGPGAEEDRQGLPFVGRSGQLLTKIIASIGFTREEIFIANVVKCRPPGNRDPKPEEIDTCVPYLREQVQLIKPKVIVTLGRFSAYFFHGQQSSMKQLRQLTSEFEGVKVVSTYHPAALLRNPNYKRDTWEDMLRAREIYDQAGGKPSSGKIIRPKSES